MRGLQGADLDESAGGARLRQALSSAMAARPSAPAQGGKGLDQGDTRVDEATLRRIHLPGYITAIKPGVGTIMPSYSSWNGVKCSASKRLLTEILKNELGFEGFLISDYNAIDQITPDYKEAIRISINAGMDMVMVPTRYREYFDDLKALVQEGKVPMSRIDDAVTRILRVKFAMGMMDPKPPPAGRPQAAKDLRLRRSIARRAAGGARVAGAAEERGARCCRSPRRRRASTSPARAPTISAISAAAGPFDWQGKSGSR